MAKTNEQVVKQETSQPKTVERARQQVLFAPPVDIVETADEVLLHADMPGVKEDTLDITVENGVLTLRGQSEGSEISEGFRLLGREYHTGDYERVFSLSEEIDQDQIKASYKNGVVTLRLPKSAPAKAKKIEISKE